MDDQTIKDRRQEVFFQSLLALGFDVGDMTKEHKIAFNKKVFCLPNQKAFEVVTQFLFMKLNEVSTNSYPIVWPILDIKNQRDFRKTTFSYLSKIAQESTIRFPLVSPSVLSSYGEPFYELYLAFVTHVVHETNKLFGGPILQRTAMDPSLYEKQAEIMQLSTISNVKRFKEIIDVTHQHLETYMKCAKNLTDYIEKLKFENASNQSFLNEKTKTVLALYSPETNPSENFTVEEAYVKLTKYLKKVEGYWNKIEKFRLKEEKLWTCISSEIDDNVAKKVLRGEDCNISIPDILKIDCSETEVELEGKKGLCIIKFLNMLIQAMKLYVKSLNEGSSFFQTYTTNSSKDTKSLEKCFELLQTLNIQLECSNKMDEKAVEELIERLSAGEMTENDKALYDELLPSPSQFVNLNNLNSQASDRFNLFDISDLQRALPLVTCKLEDSGIEISKISLSQSLQLNVLSANPLPDFTSSHLTIDAENSSQEEVFSPSQDLKIEKVTLHEEQHEVSTTSNLSNNQNITEQKEISQKQSVSDTIGSFKLSESWLLEESLNAQTLPDNLSYLE